MSKESFFKGLQRKLGKARMKKESVKVNHYRSLIDIFEDEWMTIEQLLRKYGC